MNRTGMGICVAAAALGSMLVVPLAATPANERSSAMKRTAKGAFEVKVAPITQTEHAGGTTLGRFSLAKTFDGDLEATGAGEMLTAGTSVAGSAGYVAIERIEGTLGGLTGSFVLQHLGSMAHGEQTLTITVVPDSGTGELAGLEGKLQIDIEGKAHFYSFEYSLP
jgi:hypothetical protein